MNNDIKMSNEWAMPNKNTFSIKPIAEFISRNKPIGLCIDPFANNNKVADITNDLDPQYDTNYHLDAIGFLCTFHSNSVDCVLFDPPYSSRQVAESYKSLSMSVNMQTTQSSYWSNLKREISRIVKNGGVVMTFSWNSGGIGASYGFRKKEILLVAHGGWHNDTICVCETKI